MEGIKEYNGSLNVKAEQADDGFVTYEVLEALRLGDVKAFDVVYLTYKKHLQNFVSKFINSPDTAEEITHDILALVWQKREQLKPEYGIKSLLFTMARNKSIDYLKAQKNMTTYPLDSQLLPENATHAADETIIERETRMLFEIALAHMPENRRKVYSMSQEGLSNKQIALLLDITQENVRKHLSRAYKDLESLRASILFFMFF